MYIFTLLLNNGLKKYFFFFVKIIKFGINFFNKFLKKKKKNSKLNVYDCLHTRAYSGDGEKKFNEQIEQEV